MERKAKVTQDAVNNACDELMESGKNVTVNAIIAMAGGSFSTVGAMVKNWKAEQAIKTASAIEMPEVVKTAMQKAVAVIWGAASSLADDEIDRIRKEADESMDKAKNELSEYVGEMTRLEKELEQSQNINAETGKRLSTVMTQISELTTQKTALETRLSDRDNELERMRADYKKLQAELITIAKTKAKQNKDKPTATIQGQGD